MDGTFKAFCQLDTILARVNTFDMPLVFAMQSSLMKLFPHVLTVWSRLTGLQLQPKSVLRKSRYECSGSKFAQTRLTDGSIVLQR